MRTNTRMTMLSGMAVLWASCAMTEHPVQRATLGRVATMAELEASLLTPGPVTLESVLSADWQADRSGLINLSHPTAQREGLRDGAEPIQIYFHVIRHPTRGTIIVDTGVETALRDRPEDSAMTSLVRSAMHLETLKVRAPLGEWVSRGETLRGVFLTHLHADHIAGMRDVPAQTPVYSGPGETADVRLLHLFVRSSVNRALEGKAPIAEWAFEADATQTFSGVLDIFGDGSVWALWVPGHTPGSTAYLVRTPAGPILLTGDACHTQWGWAHDVDPGSFSARPEQAAISFQRLKAFVAAHPEIQVRTGHQS